MTADPGWRPRYSGPDRNGVCLCGHRWSVHHLGIVMNSAYFDATGEAYVPEECEFFGSNEDGGLDADGRPHCERYRDERDREGAILSASPDK